MKMKILSAMVKLALAAVALPAMAHEGPNTSAAPYLQAIAPHVKFTAIMTAGDVADNGYRMVGLPDGLGAYDNEDGTITVLMNHELGNTVGAVRKHGSKGAFVSEWIIDKDTLEVVSGDDLIQQVFGWIWSNRRQTCPLVYSTLAVFALPIWQNAVRFTILKASWARKPEFS
jgi:hypothetical protein